MEKVQTPFVNFYDEWLNAQKKLINNWVDLQQSFSNPQNGNSGQPTMPNTEQAQAMWKDMMNLQMNWMENYQRLLSTWMPRLGQDQQQAPLKEWVELQNRMMNEYVEAGKKMMSSYGEAGRNFDYMKQFADFQGNMMQSMLDQARNMPFSGSKPMFGGAGDLFGLYDKWKEIYNNALGTMNKSVNMTFGGPRHDVMRDTFSSVVNSSMAYLKIFEFMAPIYKAMQQRTLTPENYQDFLMPERYKEIMDRVFEFASPQAMQEFYDLSNKVTQSMNASMQKGMQRMSEMVEKNAALMPELSNGDPSIMMKMYENILKSYQHSFEPFTKLPMEGKHAEVTALLNQVMDKYSHYATATTQFQYHMYRTGQEALEKVLKKVADKVQSGEEFKNFNELFRIWVETNEESFIEFFNTEEFGKLQADLVETGLAIKQDLQKMMEVSLEDYPIAPRSEVDELAKKVYDLDNKVHSLQKELEAARDSGSSKSSASKKTTKTAAAATE